MVQITASVAFHLSALLVCMTVLFYSCIETRPTRIQNKIFLATVFGLLLNIFADIPVAIINALPEKTETHFQILHGCLFLYFLFHAMLSPLFWCYAMCVTGAGIRYSKKQLFFYFIPFIITEVMILLNPFLHWFYYYDAGQQYQRNWGESTLYLFGAFYMIHALCTLFSAWNAMTRKRRSALLYFFAVVLTGLGVQLIAKSIQIELFAESLAMIGVMMTIENEDDRLDAGSGLYNRSALRMDLRNIFNYKQQFFILCIKTSNVDIIRRITGSASSDILAALTASYFLELLPEERIYRPAPDTFLLVLHRTDRASAHALAEQIANRFSQSWRIHDTEVTLHAAVLLAECPLDLHSEQEIFYMTDNPVPPQPSGTVLEGTGLNYLMRRATVEDAIQRGLEEHNFEVFYQPTYNLSDLSLHGAEALIRLNDPKEGRIFPDEFIPIAEQIGLIDDIDMFVLREVCDFLKGGIPAAHGVERINVNLSVIQCMQPGFVGRILKTISDAGIPRSMITFEITESVAASDYSTLSNVVRELKENGFIIAMDDYGTGYSNMQSLFSLDFDIIKIDKSILWGAETSELGKIILENSVRMIRQMNRRILVEGVETQQQINLLSAYKVDYLQGYFFSRPISKSDFIQLMEKT